MAKSCTTGMLSFMRYRVSFIQKWILMLLGFILTTSIYVYLTDGAIYYFISAEGVDETYVFDQLNYTGSKLTISNKRFPPLLEPKIPIGTYRKLLIAVKSSARSFEQRVAIRNTWGSEAKDLNLSVIFVVGRASKTQTNSDIHAESGRYQDILQGDFEDLYETLPLKTLVFKQWFSSLSLRNSFEATFYTDDDSMVFVSNLVSLLDKLKLNTPFVLGYCWLNGAPVLRSGKNGISKEVVPEHTYPPFCSGVGYLVTRSAVSRLLQQPIELRWLESLKNEDVIFTGYLRRKAKIPLFHTANVIRFKVFDVALCDRFLISAHQYNSPGELTHYWRKFQTQLQQC